MSRADIFKEALRLESELAKEQAKAKKALDACRAVKAWREGPEGPEILFEDGALMMTLVNEALAAEK